MSLNYYGKDSHATMDELPGAFGTSSSFALRLGQTVFSLTSLLFMCFRVEFYSYTAFWYDFPSIIFTVPLFNFVKFIYFSTYPVLDSQVCALILGLDSWVLLHWLKIRNFSSFVKKFGITGCANYIRARVGGCLCSQWTVVLKSYLFCACIDMCACLVVFI